MAIELTPKDFMAVNIYLKQDIEQLNEKKNNNEAINLS